MNLESSAFYRQYCLLVHLLQCWYLVQRWHLSQGLFEVWFEVAEMLGCRSEENWYFHSPQEYRVFQDFVRISIVHLYSKRKKEVSLVGLGRISRQSEMNGCSKPTHSTAVTHAKNKSKLRMKMRDLDWAFHRNVAYHDYTSPTSDNWISCQAVTASLRVGGHQALGPADCTRIGLTGSGSTFDWRYLVRSIERERSDFWLFCLISSSGSCLMESWEVEDLQINSYHFRSKPVYFEKCAR